MKNTLRILALAMVTVILTLALVSCGGPNSDPLEAKAALKENGYSASEDSTVQPGILDIAGVDGVTSVVRGFGKIDGKYEYVNIYYFEDAEAADAEWEDAQKYAEKNKDDDAEDDDFVCKKSGKMIYYGTKNGVKAAK